MSTEYAAGTDEVQPDEQPSGFDEAGFQDWYTRWADTTGINPDPDDPRHFYDYRAAYENGDEPSIGADGIYHWPSRNKSDDHPNRFIDGVDTRSGEPLPEPEAVGEIKKTEKPAAKEASAGAAPKPVEVDEDDFEPVKEKKPVEVDEDDFEPAPTGNESKGLFASSYDKIIHRPAEAIVGLGSDIMQGIGDIILRTPKAFIDRAERLLPELDERVRKNAEQQDQLMSGMAKAKGLPEPPPMMSLDDWKAREVAKYEIAESYQKASKILEEYANKLPKSDPVYGDDEPAMQFIEGSLKGLVRSAPGMALTMLVPEVAIPVIWAQIFGASYQAKIDKGIDPEVAWDAAQIEALLSTPLEFAGGMVERKVFKEAFSKLGQTAHLSDRVAKFIEGMLFAAGGEGVEEYLQQYAQEIGDIFTENPSASTEKLTKLAFDRFLTWDFQKEALYAGAGGALGGALMAGGGHTVATIREKADEKKKAAWTDKFNKFADTVQGGLETNSINAAQVVDIIDGWRAQWPENPVIARLEKMIGVAPEEATGPSMFTASDPEEIASLKTYIEGRTSSEDVIVEPAVERPGMGIVQRMGDAIGKKVRFYHGENQSNSYNGLYDADTGTIWINEDAADPFAVVLGHETLHSIKEESPDLYEKLSEVIKGKEVGFDEFITSLNKRRAIAGLAPITAEEALGREEFLADFVGSQFSNQDFWDKVNKHDPKLGQRLAQYVVDLIKKIKAAMGLNPSAEELQYVTQLEEVQDALAKVYVEFSRRKSEVQDLTAQPVETMGQKVIGAIGTALSPGAAEAKMTSGAKVVKTKAAPAEVTGKAVVVDEDDFGPLVAPEAQGEAQAGEAPKDQGKEPTPKAAPAGEAKQAEFDRLWGELTDKERKHLDFSVDDDEMSIDEKITFVKAEMAKRTSVQKPAKPFDYQNTNQEKIIHSEWEKGNNYRFILEGAGDVFRELTKGSPDAGYIREKIKRILAHIAEEDSGIHVDDSFKTSSKANKAFFEKMRQQWKDQPVTNDRQEKARQLNLAMLDGDFETAASLIDEITGKKGPVTAYRKESQDYRKKNEGRVTIPDGLEVAWEHIKSQEAPAWFGKGQWSRKEFDALVDKVDNGKKLTYNENQRFLELIDVMDDVTRNDKEMAAKLSDKEAADLLEEKGWTPVMEERPADSIPDGAQVQIDGKVYKQNGINDDGFIHLKGKEDDLLLEPYENVKIEGMKGGKAQKDDIAASLKKNDFEIDVVAMDEHGNVATVKAKASEAVAENDKQQAFARRLLECLNS